MAEDILIGWCCRCGRRLHSVALISFTPFSLVPPLPFGRLWSWFHLGALPIFQRRRQGRTRVTLLVNVWLSHRPDGVSPLPAALAASLSTMSDGPVSPLRPRFDRPVAFSPVPVGEENEQRNETPLRRERADGMASAREAGESAVVIRELLGPTLLLELRAPAPQRLLAGDLKSLHSFALVCREGRSSRISTRREERARGVACVNIAAHAWRASGVEVCADRGLGRQGSAVEGGDDAAGRRPPRKRKCEVEA